MDEPMHKRFVRFRLSPRLRGEDKGEGFEPTRLESILTLPLSFEKREATPVRALRLLNHVRRQLGTNRGLRERGRVTKE